MTVDVIIPAPLRSLTRNEKTVAVSAGRLRDAIEELERRYPGVRDRLVGEDGSLRRFVNVFVNGQDVRASGGLEAPLRDGDKVSILPAVAGGSTRGEDRSRLHSLGPYGGAR